MAPSFDVVVVSGASRGFGAVCATSLAEVYPTAHFHLLASCIDNLKATYDAVSSKGCATTSHGFNLQELSNGNKAGTKALASAIASCDAQRVLFVHSAAVLGPYKPLEKVDAADIAQVTQVNVGGSLALVSMLTGSLPSTAELTCINVSSKCAIVPGMWAELDLYSVTKAGTEFLFQTLVTKGHRVLNFAPGPMKTDMTAEYAHIDAVPWVEPVDAAKAMVTLLQTNSFKSGAHIDYLDDILSAQQAAVPPAPIAPHKCRISRIECFSSSHTMSNCTWCDEKNRETFGKCYNLHGHNYKAEFSFVGTIDPDTGMVANITDLKKILQEILGRLDHSHLNDHTDIFGTLVTTAENISRVLYEHVDRRLKEEQSSATIQQVKLWETDKNIAEYPFIL